MNKLKFTLNEDGGIKPYSPDFKITRGSYRNVLINIEVPHSLLLDSVKDTETNTEQTGNNVRIGAIIHTATGQNLQTKRYEFQRVKDYTINGIGYRLYQRKMPKEFTMWETVNQFEVATNGKLDMVINVVNWVRNNENVKVEEIVASPFFTLDIYPSAFLENAEEIAEPTDFDELQSQVQDHDVNIENISNALCGEGADNLGNYLSEKLKAGRKILIERDEANPLNYKIKISVEETNANEVPIFAIDKLSASNVQEALRELSERNDEFYVDEVLGESSQLVDNSDPHKPIVKHDTTKVDKIEGKGLSTNDFTDSLKQGLETLIALLQDDDTNVTVDTIKEVLNVFAEYPEETTIANALAEKVDKINGKGLSTNDLTNELKLAIENNINNRHNHNNKTILDAITKIISKDSDLQNDKYVAFDNQNLTEEQKAKARQNIGAGASGFSGTYDELSGKPTLNTTHTTSQNINASEILNGDINFHKISKTGNYNDLLNKPIIDNALSETSENAVQNKILKQMFDSKVDINKVGANNGIATLNDNGKIPSSQLPSYVDDVLEFDALSYFPDIGERGKIYVALNTNITYRWGGSSYIEISPSLALGETTESAFAGNRGVALEQNKANKNASNLGNEDVEAWKEKLNIVNENILINGDFQINQRGSTTYSQADGNEKYCIDRWVMRGDTKVDKLTQGIKLKNNSSSITSGIFQSLENWKNLLGKKITLSLSFSNIDVANDTQIRLAISNSSRSNSVGSTIVDQHLNANKLNINQIYSITGIVPTSLPNSNFNVSITFAGNATTAGDNISINYIKLEVGDISTAYSPRPYAEELAMCQRYYFMTTVDNPYSMFAMGIGRNNTLTDVCYNIPTMRTRPSIIYDGPFEVVCPGTGAISVTNMTVGYTSSNYIRVDVKHASYNGLISKPVLLTSQNSTTAWIAFDAEIY